MSATTQVLDIQGELQGLLLRVTSLESEVARLKQSSSGDSTERPDRATRWQRIRGSMKDDPDFAEIVRLGQEYRKNYFAD